MQSKTVMLAADALRTLAANIFEAAGTPPDIAAAVARSLLDANLAGHDSHGVIRIPQYVQRVRAGTVKAAARPAILRERGAATLVSGEWGFGQPAGHFAMDLAIGHARTYSIGVAGLIRDNHLGRVGEYMEQAAAAGCVGLAWLGGFGGDFLSVPFGGAKPLLGTNPLAAGFPAAEAGTVLLDFATTAVAGGKILVARDSGKPLPEGSIVDREGRPTTDANDFYAGGAMLPFGGHKGSALSILCELLGQALTGADTTGDEGGGGPVFRRAGAVFIAMDLGLFRPAAEAEAAAAALVERARALPPAPGFERVMTPGQPESESRTRRLNQGIPVADQTWDSIKVVATELGVETPSP